jgi:uncharacterized protein (DUF2164 family)
MRGTIRAGVLAGVGIGLFAKVSLAEMFIQHPHRRRASFIEILPDIFSVTIELTKEVRADAIASIQRYFEKNMEEPIGNIAAGALLGFFLEEIGPNIYIKAVVDAQERLMQRVSELDFEVHEEEFQYWKKYEGNAKPRK